MDVGSKSFGLTSMHYKGNGMMTALQEKRMVLIERPRSIMVLTALLSMFLCTSLSTGQTAGHTPKHTPEEEAAMEAERQAEIEAKNEMMRERARLKRMEEEREAANRLAEREANKYRVDSVLAEIVRESLSDHRDRNEVEQKLVGYIEKNPDSVFIPELYFRLGAMYSHNALPPNEGLDRKKATRYFEKAHDLFDGKYSVASDCAWAYLVMRRDVPVAQKREYYDWLRKTKELTPEDIWPYRDVEKCMIYGDSPELSQAELAKEADDWQQRSKVFVAACERTLIMYADLAALGVYAAGYPETELGKQAQMKLQKRDDVIDRVLMEDLDKSLAVSSPAVTSNETYQSDTAPHDLSSAGVPKQDGAGGYQNLSTTTRWYLCACIGVAVLLISGVLVFWLRRRKTFYENR